MNAPTQIRLRTLGPIGLTRPDGSDITSVLSQPKRLALLVYLTVANGGALCRRDTVLGILWPEFDQERARAALRKALHFLRHELGDGVIVSRGADEIGVDGARLSCDVYDFRTARGARDRVATLQTYTGEFLDGFFINDSPEFEQWIDATRRELHHQAAQAAESVTDETLKAGDSRAAAAWAERWVRLAPLEEAATRAWMTALDQRGERAQALQAYGDLAQRMQELQLEPSPATRSLATLIRQRKGGQRSHSVDIPRADQTSTTRSPPTRRRRLALGLAALGGLAAVGILTDVTRRSPTAPDGDIGPHWIIVAEFDGSADSAILNAAQHLMTVALDLSPAWQVVPADHIDRGKAIAAKPDSARLTEDLALELALRGRVPVVITGRLDRVGSTYAVSLRALNADSGTVISAVQEIARSDDDVIPTMDTATKQLVRWMGADPAAFGPAQKLSYVMTPSMEALQAYLAADRGGPEVYLWRAVSFDSSFSQAWKRLATRMVNRLSMDSAKVAVRNALSRPDRLTEYERHQMLAIERAAEYDYQGTLRHFINAWKVDRGQLAAHDVAAAYNLLGQWEEGVEWYQLTKPAPFGRHFFLIQNEIQALRALGRLEEAKSVLDELRSADLPRYNLTVHILAQHLLSAEWIEAESVAVEVAADPISDWRTRAHAMGIEALLHWHRGSSRAAWNRLQEARNIQADSGSIGAARGFDHDLRLMRLYRPDLGSARTDRHVDQFSAYGLVENALDAALAGQTDDARALITRMRSLSAKSVRFLAGAPEVVAGAIEAAEGDWDAVLDILTPLEEWAWPHRVLGTPSYGSLVLHLLAEAYESTGQLDSAAAYWKRLTSPVEVARRSGARKPTLHHSFAHRRLVLLYSRMDRVDDAESHWEIFRETFTDADPELVPLVDEARNALEKARTR